MKETVKSGRDSKTSNPGFAICREETGYDCGYDGAVRQKWEDEKFIAKMRLIVDKKFINSIIFLGTEV